jgi:hypothetical protein
MIKAAFACAETVAFELDDAGHLVEQDLASL